MSPFEILIMYQTATMNLYKIGGPILIILGTIGSFLCLSVFAQKTMRKSTGSIYFIAFNISNLLLLWIVLTPFVYRYTTGFDLTLVSSFYCKLRVYLLNLLIILPQSYLILASIDRVLITSRNAVTRRRSTYRLALFTISAVTLAWCIYYLYIWFLVHIQSIGPGMFICFFKPGASTDFASYSTMTLTGFLPPFLMAIFGIMTMKNFRHLRIHPRTNENSSTPLSSKDRQIAVILLFEILMSIIFSTAGSILFVYTQRIPNNKKTLEEQALDYFLLDFGLNLVFMQATLSPYLNLLVSKKFRKNSQKFIWKLMPHRCQQALGNHGIENSLNPLPVTATMATHRGRTIGHT